MVIFSQFQGVQAVWAAAGPWQGDETFSARLITAVDDIGSSDQLNAGLEVKLSKGWKIYWRSPGDAGLPPELDFSESSAITSHDMDFPAPYRFTVLGFESYGYKDHVIFPVTLNLAETGRNITVVATFTGLVCDDVCIPINETLTITLPRGKDAIASPEARDLARFAAMVPRPSTSGGINVSSLSIDDDQLNIRFSKGDAVVQMMKGDVFIEGPEDDGPQGYSFARPRILGDDVTLAISGGDPALLKGRSLTITAVTPDWLLEDKVVVASAGSGGVNSIASGLIAMVVIAFLGGVVLNIMPCVLPVISLKLAQVVGMGGQDKQLIRISFLATAAGILTSFILLGGMLFGLREAGVAIGWGIQFQNIYFLGAAAASIIIFGLVMIDLITIPVPQQFAAIGRGQSGYVGDFLTGFMATLLATPCSAPFVGTALTFALTAPGHVLIMMFIAMGLGLASPWIIVAISPSLAARLPRPGPWLIHLKKVLSLGLFGTAIWLITIIFAITSDSVDIDDNWQAWSPGAAVELAQEGNVVFVDVTAAWCLTCKANKALVLDTDEMMTYFDDANVIRLRADWTKPDPNISAFLTQHDRFGIPFNIVYGPDALSGIILPELLTRESVRSAIIKAAP